MNRYKRETGRRFPWWRHPDANRATHCRALVRARGLRWCMARGGNWFGLRAEHRLDMDFASKLKSMLEALP